MQVERRLPARLVGRPLPLHLGHVPGLGHLVDVVDVVRRLGRAPPWDGDGRARSAGATLGAWDDGDDDDAIGEHNGDDDFFVDDAAADDAASAPQVAAGPPPTATPTAAMPTPRPTAAPTSAAPTAARPTPAPTAAAPTAKPTSPMKLLGLNTPAPTLPVLYSNFPLARADRVKATAAPTLLDDEVPVVDVERPKARPAGGRARRAETARARARWLTTQSRAPTLSSGHL